MFFTYYPPTFQTKHKHDGKHKAHHPFSLRRPLRLDTVGKTKMQLIKEIDYIGLLLFMAGCVLFLLGINYGGRQYPWTSAQVIAPVVVGVLCLISLGFYEVYADLPQPIMPPRLFRKWREVTMIYVVCFVGGMLYCKCDCCVDEVIFMIVRMTDKPAQTR